MLEKARKRAFLLIGVSLFLERRESGKKDQD